MLEKWRCVEVTTEVIHYPERPSREEVRVRLEGTLSACCGCPLYLFRSVKTGRHCTHTNADYMRISEGESLTFPDWCPWLKA